MEKYNLTFLISSYKNGNLVKNDLVCAISLFVYRFPSRLYRWKEDECSDFFCYFYPKISRMIDSFEIREIPFEAYLTKTLKLQIKTFAAKKAAEKIAIKILKHKEFWPYEELNNDFYCSEKLLPGSYGTFNLQKENIGSEFIRKPFIKNNKTMKKRILMLALKNINYLTENDICEVEKLSDCESRWLEKAGNELKIRISGRISRKEKLSERRNRFFYKLYFLHENFSLELLSEDKNTIFNKTIKVKNQIDCLTRRINNISDLPTHQDIAEIMKIPKGSVDSGLFYLRIYLEKI